MPTDQSTLIILTQAYRMLRRRSRSAPIGGVLSKRRADLRRPGRA